MKKLIVNEIMTIRIIQRLRTKYFSARLVLRTEISNIYSE